MCAEPHIQPASVPIPTTGPFTCNALTSLRLFTAAALALDVHTQRSMTRLGAYDQMGMGASDLKRALQARSSAAANGSEADLADATHGYRAPSLEFPEYSHEIKRPYRVQRPIEAQHFGYTAPSEQTRYDGASATALDRDFDEIRS